MYNEFYHFKEKPFSLTPDPEFLYPSKSHKRAFAYLEYGIKDPSGFVCITGEIGTGKTTLLRVFLNSLDNEVQVARVFNTKASSSELLAMILQDLGVDPFGKTKTELIDALNKHLVETFAKGSRVVLVIDEAQNLSEDLLEEIRLLSNLETEKTKLLQIILVGQSELRGLLQRSNLEQFRQRITVNYHIPPLDRDETAAYIRHRIKVAGDGAAVDFPDPVINVIHQYSRGVPRLINVISDALLLYGFVEEKKQPDEVMIDTVVKDMIGEGTLRDPFAPGQPAAASAPVDNAVYRELTLLRDKVRSLEERKDAPENTLADLVELTRGLLDQQAQVRKQLEEIHSREKALAVLQETLKHKDEELSKRERVINNFMLRAKERMMSDPLLSEKE
jgi:putative secretion ATPase (PEP-CTERM system associated)